MKLLKLILLSVILFSFANGQTKTTVRRLPLFDSHQVLASGSKSDTTPAQTINNLSLRTEYWLNWLATQGLDSSEVPIFLGLRLGNYGIGDGCLDFLSIDYGYLGRIAPIENLTHARQWLLPDTNGTFVVNALSPLYVTTNGRVGADTSNGYTHLATQYYVATHPGSAVVDTGSVPVFLGERLGNFGGGDGFMDILSDENNYYGRVGLKTDLTAPRTWSLPDTTGTFLLGVFAPLGVTEGGRVYVDTVSWTGLITKYDLTVALAAKQDTAVYDTVYKNFIWTTAAAMDSLMWIYMPENGTLLSAWTQRIGGTSASIMLTKYRGSTLYDLLTTNCITTTGITGAGVVQNTDLRTADIIRGVIRAISGTADLIEIEFVYRTVR